MSSKVRVKCPTCQVTLQVNSDMCGKQISCPKCKSALMLPALQAFEPSPVQQSAVPNTIGSSPNQPTHSIWDDPNTFANTAPQNNNVPQWTGNSWGHQQSPGAHSPTATYSSRPKTKPAKKTNADLTEQESGLQASGMFLIAVPVITTLLPLFGVQLRRLAGLGNYAPLGGLFLGLIGSGIIVWARRKRSDALAMGAIGAVCSIVFGIGGYSILEFMDSQADAAMVENEVAAPPAVPAFPSNSGAAPSSSATYTVGNEGFVETGPDRSAVPGTPSGYQPPSAPLQSSPPSANAPTNSAWQESKARRNDASQFEQDMETSFELSRTYSKGFTDVSLFDIQQGGEPKLLNMVGSESPHSSLFARKAVKGVCGFAMGSAIQLVPITQVTQKMKAAVLAGDQEELYGLRFAFDGSRIVGYQGLLNSKESSSPKETEWFGRKTDNVKESLNPKPGKTGIMCFQNGADFVGFGWVML